MASPRVLAVCLGPGGIPKHPVESARVTALGLEGDRHRHPEHGGERRAVCLLTVEELRLLEADGVPVDGPGTLGENLLVEGLPIGDLAPGDRLVFEGGVVLVLDDVREPCGTLKRVDRRFPDLMVGRSGWMCRVECCGQIRAGEGIRYEVGGVAEGGG